MKVFQTTTNLAIITLVAASASIGISFNTQALQAQSSTLVAQANKTRKIVLKDFGYSFDVPTWARVIRDGNHLIVLTQTNYEQRQRGLYNCTSQDSPLAGCSDFSISIEGNGQKRLAEQHQYYITPCNCGFGSGPNTYKGKITINGKRYRKYEIGDEHGEYNFYLHLTKRNHLLTVVLDKAPYAGNRDALVTMMGSFK